jgi:predicted nucleotidyltransferase
LTSWQIADRRSQIASALQLAGGSSATVGDMEQVVRNVLGSDERVAFALLFGSAARGRTTPFSDVDIAIGLMAGVRLDHRALGEMTARLEQATRATVDLIVIEEASPGLAYRAFRDGRLLFERDRSARVERQVRAILEYLDFKPVELMCARAVLDAVSHG